MLKTKSPDRSPEHTPHNSPQRPSELTPLRNAMAATSLRSVSRIVTSFPIGVQLWHVISTIPGQNFYTDHGRLDVLLDAFIEANSLHADDAYTQLSQKLLNMIINSRGVYYLVTDREAGAADLEVYAYHISHTILHEKINGIKIRGADHLKKAKAFLKQMLRVRADLDYVLQDCTGRELRQLLHRFSAYIYVQTASLKLSIDYVEDKKLPGHTAYNPIEPALLQRWQAEPPAHRTPVRPSLAAIDALQHKRAYQLEIKRRLDESYETQENQGYADPATGWLDLNQAAAAASAATKASPEKRFKPEQ